MDAFFASIEERDNPRFAGQPIVVGADPRGGAGRGVVSTANYAARVYGIRSALPISKAWQFSEAARRRGLPPAIFTSVNMKKYGEVSRRVMEILRAHAAIVEEASVDEAYFDLSFVADENANDLYARAAEIARALKDEIKMKEKLTASVGIGPNKLIAKIASDAQKPDGLTVVRAEAAENFLAPLSVRKIPGVGPKAEERFKKLGIATVAQARELSMEELREMMGKWGTALYERLRARDETSLVEEYEAKSVGEQETFERDTRDPAFLQERVRKIARGVHARFIREAGRDIGTPGHFSTFRTITLTVRFADFSTKNRSVTLAAPDARMETIEFQAIRLFMPFLDQRENPGRKAIRLLGVRVEKLV